MSNYLSLLFILFFSILLFGQNRSSIQLDEGIGLGESIISENSLFTLKLDEGVLSLKSKYRSCVKWSLEVPKESSIVLTKDGLSSTTGKLLLPVEGSSKMIMDSSGDLLIYGELDNVLWTSETTDIANYDIDSSNRLLLGESLNPGEYLITKNNQFKLFYGLDGNLILYGFRDSKLCNPEKLWSSDTKGLQSEKFELRDGSFVALNKRSVVYHQDWQGYSSELVLKEDGKLLVESADDKILWEAEIDWESWYAAAPKPLEIYEELNNKCVELSYSKQGTKEKIKFEASGYSPDYHVYIKENHLGKLGYLFYNKGRKMLSSDANGDGLEMQGVSDFKSLWYIEDLIEGELSDFSGKAYLKNATSGKYIGLQEGSIFSLTEVKEDALVIDLSMGDQEECWYKKVDLAVEEVGSGKTNMRISTKEDNGREVLYGAIDAHAHPIAHFGLGGTAVNGKMFSEKGIEDALPDSDKIHGPQGVFNLFQLFLGDELGNSSLFGGIFNNISFWTEDFWTKTPERLENNISIMEELLDGNALHMYDTAGYPEFTSWPAHDNISTQSFYYEWLNRARLGGLRMINMLANESKAGCKLLEFGYKPLILIDPAELFIKRPDCSKTEMEIINKQLEEIDKLEEYVNKYEGGWLKVVTSSKEAREAVRAGKLAIVKGIETPALFDCINWVGDERKGRVPCSESYIKNQVEELKKKRVSYVFPTHHYDNDFGGANGFQQNDGVHLLNFVATGSAFTPEKCNKVGRGKVKPFLTADNNPIAGTVKFFLTPLIVAEDLVDVVTLPDFPVAPAVDIANEPGWCNAKGLSEQGRVLISSLMENGIFIDFDHMSIKSALDAALMLDEFEYPISSSHFTAVERIMDDVAYSKNLNPNDEDKLNGFQAILGWTGDGEEGCKANTSHSFAKSIINYAPVNKDQFKQNLSAFPFATDFNGGPSLKGPRYENNKFERNFGCDQSKYNKLAYPFTSFDGNYVFDRMTSGYRIFDYNYDGLSTIGQFPDLVADMQAIGYTDEQIAPLFRGAEMFIRVWEDIEEASKKVKAAKNKRLHQTEFDVELYPTMVESGFSLENNSNKPIVVNILKENGNVVSTAKFGSEKEIRFDDLSYLSKGIYFVNITDQSGSQNKTVKIIKK